MTERYIAAIDQGTTSSRCMIFNEAGAVAASAQVEHHQHYPKPGWVEHDAQEIWANVSGVVSAALAKVGIGAGDLAAVGITNQRETTVVWEKASGRPIANAIVWQDTRTAALVAKLGGAEGKDRFRDACGLPLATYFSGPKLIWLLDEVDGARQAAGRGELLFGTMDSWLIWNLTGEHVTDVTNASRTMLMNLATLDWDDELLAAMNVPRAMLPRIVSSSKVFGKGRGVLGGVPVASALGDQQAALFGQTCFSPGEGKCTYGTGNFLLVNTGETPVTSQNGLLTTVGYRIGDQPAIYALEGSIAVTGALIQWLRDNLGIIHAASEVEDLAKSVPDNGGCYFVPAFSGLFAPHWRSDARGVIAGLTGFVKSGHIARAALEAVAWQTREVVDAMTADSGQRLTRLKVDGGMTANELLMQFQADVLDTPVSRPAIAETTCLGAAYAAGLAVGFWPGLESLRAKWREEGAWTPAMSDERRSREFAQWSKAVERSLDWET
ncbi:MAG TPA: glycerol kinase GlpK [Caulobacteraceae bacterium]|jgi:glycerol kinase